MIDVTGLPTEILQTHKVFFVLTIDDVIQRGDLIRCRFLDGWVNEVEEAKYHFNWKTVDRDIPAWIGKTQRDLIKELMGSDYYLHCKNDVVRPSLIQYEIIRML